MGKHYANPSNIIPIEERVSAKALKRGKELIEDRSGGRGWKLSVKPFKTLDGKFAKEIAEVFDFYLGGSELNVETIHDSKVDGLVPLYLVSSRGYYHNIGA